MTIRKTLKEVLQLQHSYSRSSTDAMTHRGRLVRENIANFLRTEAPGLSSELGINPTDLLIEGKDGIGNKSMVPWVRFATTKRSPSATQGWYVVLLFREDGSGLYMTLAHASTTKEDRNFKNRSLQDTQKLLGWAHSILATHIQNEIRLTKDISLGRGKLAKAYELTSAVAYFYANDSIPDEEHIRSDLRKMAGMLRSIYANEDLQKRTGETSLEVIATISAAEDSTESRQNSKNQGFGLTQPERRAVEQHAMQVAAAHLESLGYQVEDTSAKHPYDFKATRLKEVISIEVKGTTGAVGDIVLTKNEVKHHLHQHPNNGLIMVHSIQLLRTDTGPQTSGGVLEAAIPWQIESRHLEPISYRYQTEELFS